jgi:nreA protein
VGLADCGISGYNNPHAQEVTDMEELQEHTHDPKSPEEEHAYLHAHGISHAHGHVHESQKAVINRLSRAIGHLEKVRRMVENGEDCSNVLIQLAAVRSALDNTGKVILKDHMRHCMVDAVAAGDEEAIDDLCQAIDKFMK